ncbi:carbohydrate kinase family protein [Candidatus Woesearchaeota archaeon]|nr:carbohydrate kinase family protein [Candidatus Woesearchaeota archaeon]
MSKKSAGLGGKASADFFVVGSSTLDIIAKTSDVERIDIGGRHAEHLVCISYGSKSELSAIDLRPGGSASNSAVVLRSLGGSVRLLSGIGKDEFGSLALGNLKKAGIVTGSVKVFPKAKTGVGVVLVSGGEKSILAFRGANSLLGSSDIRESDVVNCRRVFVTSLVSAQNYGLFEKIISLSTRHRKPVVFAPSITMLHDWAGRIRRTHHLFDMVIVNYEEGRYFTGKSEIKEILGSLPGKVAVVMKDVDGAYAAFNGTAYHVTAVPVKVKDTTGAGDAFSAAFAHSYYGGKSISEALRVGAAAAAMKITHEGTQFRIGRSALASFIKAHSASLAVRRI